MPIMTTEIALARLSRNTFDTSALEQLYFLNNREIRKTIQEWFGGGSIFDDVLSRSLAKIATQAPQFRPERQSPETFVIELVNAECRRTYDEAWARTN